MKERIIQIMTDEGFSPSRFAEEIGIQRAAMSHITAGRNKPSLDVVTKILERFPAISPDWLLYGKGAMKRDSATVDSFSDSSSMDGLDLFANAANNQTTISNSPENRTEKEVQKTAIYAKQPVKEVFMQQKVQTREVMKIMVFYSDNTFETFNPDKK